MGIYFQTFEVFICNANNCLLKLLQISKSFQQFKKVLKVLLSVEQIECSELFDTYNYVSSAQQGSLVVPWIDQYTGQQKSCYILHNTLVPPSKRSLKEGNQP